MIILSVNAGSSSLKATAYNTEEPTHPLASRSLEMITSHEEAAREIQQWLETDSALTGRSIDAIGHRVVHGGADFWQPSLITDDVLTTLKSLTPLAPNHMPGTLAVMRAFLKAFPSLPQVACFDTGFFHDIPDVARIFPLPLSLQEDAGIRRYGFHGLAYEALLASFAEQEGIQARNGKVILAHLGSGASLAACKHGQPIDMTMGFTPISGIMMSTRSGDLEPGVLTYLEQYKNMNSEDITQLVANKSGLLGVSGLSADMKTLLDAEHENSKAHLAIDLFCYKIAKTIGGFAAALGGVDSLIFSGGIGERSAEIRRRICENLAFLGITIDPERNAKNARLISAEGARAGVHIIPAQEDTSILRQTLSVITNKETA